MIALAVAGFDWDAGNREKCRAHGVSIEEIDAMFRRPIAIHPDVTHSLSEERFKAIGQTDEGRNVLLVFTLRKRGNLSLIRPIGARYMHRREVGHYEKVTKTKE